MGKGYPMGYHHIPFFLQCMFGTGAFEDLFFLFIRDPPHTGVSQETRKENTCTGLCMKDLCIILPDSFKISFRFDNQNVCQGAKQMSSWI